MKNKNIFLAVILVSLWSMAVLAAPSSKVKLSPQTMYLSAGKSERMGDVNAAKELYQQISDNFPKSPLALKANDRLLEIKAQEDTAEKERQAAMQVKEDRKKAQAVMENERRQQAERAFLNCSLRTESCRNSCLLGPWQLTQSCMAGCDQPC